MANLFLTPLAELVRDVHRQACSGPASQAVAVDRQGNVELLPTSGTAAEQAIARRSPEIAGNVSPRCNRRFIALMLLRRMTQLVMDRGP